MLHHLEQQKSLTRNQWKIFAAATLGDMLDFYDFYLIGFILAFVVKGWSLTYGESGLVLLASGIAAPLGSLFWGWMADKIGRRKVMILTVLNFSIPTGLMALTPEHGWIFLAVCRFFVGLGVTGLYTVDVAIVQEFVPAKKRGWVTGLTTSLLPAGTLLGALSGARDVTKYPKRLGSAGLVLGLVVEVGGVGRRLGVGIERAGGAARGPQVGGRGGGRRGADGEVDAGAALLEPE